jgi:hypothetical protein
VRAWRWVCSHQPSTAVRLFRFPDGVPEPTEFNFRQETLASFLWILVDAARGIKPGWNKLSLAGESKKG